MALFDYSLCITFAFLFYILFYYILKKYIKFPKTAHFKRNPSERELSEPLFYSLLHRLIMYTAHLGFFTYLFLKFDNDFLSQNTHVQNIYGAILIGYYTSDTVVDVFDKNINVYSIIHHFICLGGFIFTLSKESFASEFLLYYFLLIIGGYFLIYDLFLRYFEVRTFRYFIFYQILTSFAWMFVRIFVAHVFLKKVLKTSLPLFLKVMMLLLRNFRSIFIF